MYHGLCFRIDVEAPKKDGEAVAKDPPKPEENKEEARKDETMEH